MHFTHRNAYGCLQKLINEKVGVCASVCTLCTMCLFVCVSPCTEHASVCVCACCRLHPLCAVHENTSHTQRGPAHGKINMLVIEIC